MFQELTGLWTSATDLILSLVVIRQLTIVFIVLLAAWLLQFPLRRILQSIESRLADISWTDKLLIVTRSIMLPFSARLLSQLAVEIFQGVGHNSLLLEWAGQLITLWFGYCLIAALFEVNLSARQARFWTRRVLLPIILVIAALQVVGLLPVVLAWGFSLGQMNLRITIGSIVLGLVTVFIFFAVSRGARQFLRQIFLPQAGAEPALAQAISALVSYAIVITGAGVALSAMGIDLTTLAVIAGGLSVGLGFGLQAIVNNFVSGFILLFDRSLSPGDVVQIGDNVGVVQSVGIRSVTIRTRDNIELIVPNSHFLTEIVTNLTRGEQRVRVRISVGVSYQADPRTVEQTLLEAAADHPLVLSTPAPRVQFQEFGDSSLNFDLLVWTDDAARIPFLSSDLRYNIWDALAARQIEIPFPQRDIHIRSGVPWSELTPASHPSAKTSSGDES